LFVTVRSNIDTGGTDDTQQTGGRQIAIIVICTYEHAASLLQRGGKSLGPYQGTIVSHVGMVIIDKRYLCSWIGRNTFTR
jgi:hypothetical protein